MKFSSRNWWFLVLTMKSQYEESWLNANRTTGGARHLPQGDQMESKCWSPVGSTSLLDTKFQTQGIVEAMVRATDLKKPLRPLRSYSGQGDLKTIRT